MILLLDFSLFFPVVTGTIQCGKYLFPAIFFPKSRNTVLKIFISRPLANTTPSLHNTDPKEFSQLGHCTGLQSPLANLNAFKGPSYYPQSIMLQFQICYYNHLNDSQKTKTNINFRGQAWVRPLQSAKSRSLFYPISLLSQISTKDYGILQLTRNAKTNNNIAGHHLVSRRVISTASDVQRVYKYSKRTFILSQKYYGLSSFKYFIIATYTCRKKKLT